jgi:Restriction endonuclease
MPKSRKRPKLKHKPKNKPEPKWESFERIVAAIHLAETKGASVAWNKQINGRQFDVVIRFKVGFYEYLTLIECKDYKTPVSVGKVEAFITKAGDHKANKAVMVSASGFQSGAKEVAIKHNIELYSLRQINRLPDEVLTDVFLSFVVVSPFAFRHEGNPAFVFSPDPNTLQYELEHIRFTGYGNLKIEDLIRPFTQLVHPTPLPGVPEVEKEGFPWKRATETPIRSGWRMMDGTMLILPDNGGEIPVSEFLFKYWAETVRLINPAGPDPSIFTSFGKQYEYKNELNDDVTLIDPTELPMGVNTVFEQGKFYGQPQLRNFVYYCEKIDGEFADMLLVRSYQFGQLVRMQMKEPLASAKSYLEITDEKDIEAAQKLLAEFIEHRKNHEPQATSPSAFSSG